MIREIDLEKDYGTYAKMIIDRGVRPIRKEFLPDTGFIIDDFCTCFVYKTNSKVCFIEHLVASRNCTHEMLMNFLKHIVEWSKAQGFELLTAVTSLDVVVEHAKSFGAKASDGYTFLFKKLN